MSVLVAYLYLAGAYISASFICLVLGIVVYYLLSQDKLDKPLFDSFTLFNKIFKPFMQPYVRVNGGCFYLEELSEDDKRLVFKEDTDYLPRYAYLDRDGDLDYTTREIPKIFEFAKDYKEHETEICFDIIKLIRWFFIGALVAWGCDFGFTTFAGYPVVTLSILGTIVAGVSIRFLSGRLWKVTAKTNNHETRIKKLEGE